MSSMHLVRYIASRSSQKRKSSYHWQYQGKNWSFQESGRQQAMAKSYGNVTHPPILKHADSTPIIDIIAPPELHLMIRTANTLYNGLLKIWPDAKRWPDACHVAREFIHGGTFNANSSKKLLEKSDKGHLSSASPCFRRYSWCFFHCCPCLLWQSIV